ncbi:MAG TPA: AMP-binding protein [Syntrophorhabdales bacterium]|nr:AMP-binding protein [Syntrophorhabdales bacterium]
MIATTPLEAWIRKKASISPGLAGKLFAEALEDYQLRQINETIEYARRNTSFYGRHLASLPGAPLGSLSDVGRIPFTTPPDVARDPFAFLAVRQSDVARIVTLRTSASTGEAKRLFFTDEDLELTIDFFHHGMSTLVRPGQRVMVFLPGERADSVGDLLVRGLARMDVPALAYGPVSDPADAARALASFGAHCLVGIPTQVLALASSPEGAALGKDRIESVLLTTDYVPRAIADTVERVWGCSVFNHYGMTETGLGGGVECEALDGYHLREADLYFEVVDHETGEPIPDGTMGEVVFTTLTRRGMPLIRYRTGDMACIMAEPCPCAASLRRMAPVRGRWEGVIALGPGPTLFLSDMDEVLFRLPGLLDYRATLSKGGVRRFRLHIDAYAAERPRPTEEEVQRKLHMVDAIRTAIAASALDVPTVSFSSEGRWVTTGVAKRRIVYAS